SGLGATRVESTTLERSGSATRDAATGASGRAIGRRRSDRIISASAAMQQVVDQASAIARSDEAVLIRGQSGTGRRHVARAIHQWSTRAGGVLVEVALAGLAEAAQLRELFGDGAAAPGAVARARSGSLLLQDAEQLATAVAHKLGEALRATNGSVQRPRLLATVGAGADTPLSVVGGTRIEISPLSARSEDVLPLAAHFLAEIAAEESIEPIGFSPDARRWLVEERWPGNVRELRERIRQAIRLSGQAAVSAEALMLATDGDDVPSFKDAKRAFETRYVEGLLRRCGGNISRAARMAKKDRKDFYDVIRRTGVDPAQFRG
ncbi:MAG TPA: sigma 54-interacting transcriptional regulator, partial [Myxococcota bacterium]|nr:sigma 54-interacting transcriptional regulator [Myxococcota bacterium]